jgi:hypothetical protein
MTTQPPMTAGCRIKWQGSSTSAVTPVGFTFGASLLDQISPALTETDAPKPNGEIPSHRLCVLPDLLVRSIDLLCVADLNQHSEPIVAETHTTCVYLSWAGRRVASSPAERSAATSFE